MNFGLRSVVALTLWYGAASSPSKNRERVGALCHLCSVACHGKMLTKRCECAVFRTVDQQTALFVVRGAAKYFMIYYIVAVFSLHLHLNGGWGLWNHVVCICYVITGFSVSIVSHEIWYKRQTIGAHSNVFYNSLKTVTVLTWHKHETLRWDQQ